MLREFSDIDLKHLKNIKTAIIGGRFELSGAEAIEIARMVAWLDEMHLSIQAHMSQKVEERALQIEEMKKSKTEKGKKK